MIYVSDKAKKRVLSIMDEKNFSGEDFFLRVSVQSGGCSGLSYKMDFDSESNDVDKYFESFGQKIGVDAQSFLYLIGMTLDYSGGLNGKGFVFNNPNATKACGCGSSFNV